MAAKHKPFRQAGCIAMGTKGKTSADEEEERKGKADHRSTI